MLLQFVSIQIHLAAYLLVPALPLSTTRRIASLLRSVYRDPASLTSTATSRTSSTVLLIPCLPLSLLDTQRLLATSSNSPPYVPSCRTSSTRACYYISLQIYTGLYSRNDTRLRSFPAKPSVAAARIHPYHRPLFVAAVQILRFHSTVD